MRLKPLDQASLTISPAMASVRSKNICEVIFPKVVEMLIAFVGIAALSCIEARAQTPSVMAVVVPAANGCFASEVRFTGLVVPRTEAIVDLNNDGYEISEVLVAQGDMVTSGQALAKLKRLGNGAPAGVGGGQPAAAAATNQQPATMSLTAPVGGLVSASTATIGAVAAVVPLPPPMGPEPLFRIIVGNKLEIQADVPSFEMPKVKNGELARVLLENGHDVSGQVRIVFPEIDRGTQLGKVRLTLESDPAIRAGMFARGTIFASHSCGVSIPRSAVQYLTEGTTVQVVLDTTVETRRVKLGLHSDTDVEVLDGVKDGEPVIANAGSSLHDGDRIKPLSPDEADRLGAH
jgi:multidrug efflux pump subunit AcrA (membrane-fusion protein)